MKNTRTHIVWFAISVLVLILASGCRDPFVDDDWTPDVDDFDANVEDDSGPGELCPEGSMDLFNNYYSPYVGGDESVDLEVVDYSYFRCPHCATFAGQWEEVFADRDDVRDRVRFYFHHYPFNYESAWSLHATAVAAGNQGMENFWAVHDYIYEGMRQDDPEYYSADDVSAFVDAVLNLNMSQYNDDLADPTTLAFLEWDKNQALEQGIGGTPSVFLCGQKVSWGALENRIDDYLYPPEE